MSHAYKREKHETALNVYLNDRRLSDYTFAKMLGVNQDAIKYWRWNLSLPSLCNAFKIERVTKGAVPAVYWLDTPRGVATMSGDKDE